MKGKVTLYKKNFFFLRGGFFYRKEEGRLVRGFYGCCLAALLLGISSPDLPASSYSTAEYFLSIRNEEKIPTDRFVLPALRVLRLPRLPKPKPKGGHTKNKRPSSKGKHEKGDARRQKEQKKAQEKRKNQKKR